MKIPDKFIMSNSNGSLEWVFEKMGGEYICTVHYNRNSPTNKGAVFGPYTERRVEEFIYNDGFSVKEDLTDYNGVDGEGNPINFSESNLKLLQRCVFANGDEVIVTQIGEVVAGTYAKDDTWCGVQLENVHDSKFNLVKVYDAPMSPWMMLNPEYKGKLVWERTFPKEDCSKEHSALQKRVEFFQTHIDAVQENLESLKAEFEKLKEETQ